MNGQTEIVWGEVESEVVEANEAADWPEYNLNLVYDFASGLSKPREEFGFGFGFLSFKDVFHNYFLPDTLSNLVNSSEKERKSGSIKRGDLFLTRTSETQEELGMSSVALKDYPDATFNGFTKRLRPKGTIEVLPEFAGFFFRSPRFRAEVTSMSSVTTRASLNNEMMSALKITVPPLPEQRAIANVLSCLNDKIDLLHRQNATLEALAETLFRQWFVEFDFPDDNGKPYRKSGGEIVETELGFAPKAWTIGKVNDIVNVTDFVANGSFASLKENVTLYDYEEYALYIRTTDFNGSWKGNLKYTDLPSFNFLRKSSLQPDDIIISNVGDVGTVFRPPAWLGKPMTLGSNAICLKSPLHNHYLYFHFISEEGQHQIAGITGGSAQPKFNKTDFRSLQVLLPSQKVLHLFNDFCQTVFNSKSHKMREIQTLTKLRDTLLPKLISGEVRVAY